MTISSSSNSSSSSYSDSEVNVVYPDLDGNDISVTCRGATAPEINYFFEDDEKCEEEKQPAKKKIKKEKIDDEEYFNDSFSEDLVIVENDVKQEEEDPFVGTLKKQSDIYLVEEQFKNLNEKISNLLIYGTDESIEMSERV